MPPVSGDHLKITAISQLDTETDFFENTWNFQVDSNTFGAELDTMGSAIAAAFFAKYYTPLTIYQSSLFKCTGIKIRKYGDEVHGYEHSSVYVVGAGTATLLPPFVTYSCKLQRTGYVLRNGRKGFGGANISSLGGNGHVTPAFLSGLNAIALDWSISPLTVTDDGDEMVLIPEIVREIDGIHTPPTVFCHVASFHFNSSFGSQNTRKS